MDTVKVDTTQNLLPINIEDEMKESYLSYAMSVIIGRALPDVRDGLKPVHRRILFAMHELSNNWNKAYKKSARVVGDVIGKYHPHGDVAVYDAIVRMAQHFSLRYPLIDGQGNFGSIDGDAPAAMRYTEVRMGKITDEILTDIDKETVDFAPNYDESLTEPLILPSRVPNLLINGSSGIAVGMATNIPPHNLTEIIDGTIHLIDSPNATVDELIKYIPAPDFPTGAYICGDSGVKQAYRTGRGIFKMRAKAEIVPLPKGDRSNIIVTEIPFQVNKARLIEKIAELVRAKKITGISDIRDESDKDGLRVVIELKKESVPQITLNQLYKETPLESSFGVIMLAIVDNRPRVLNLKEILNYFIEHRKEVIRRRSLFLLKKAEERLHILQGLIIALSNIDEVVALIKKSKEPVEAKENLRIKFNLTNIQAQAILDMRLQRLTSLETSKIKDESTEKEKEIKKLRKILAEESVLLEHIKEELIEIKNNFGDKRKTEVIEKSEDIAIEDLIQDEEMVITISHAGYMKRNSMGLYRSQRRGGKGATGMDTKEEDFVSNLFIASMHSYLLFFTNLGKIYWKKVHEVPEAARAARGKSIANLLNVKEGEKIAAVLPVKKFEAGKYVVMLTRFGIIKKVDLMAFSNPRPSGIIALTFKEGDSLIAAKITTGQNDIFIAKRDGQAIRFSEEEVRPMGRTAAGVRAVSLINDDYVVGFEILEEGYSILTVTERGFGKRTGIDEYRVQGRGGMGIITVKTTERNGKVVGTCKVKEEDEVMIVTNKGQLIRTKVSTIPIIGRNTQGVTLLDVPKDEWVSDIEIIREKNGDD